MKLSSVLILLFFATLLSVEANALELVPLEFAVVKSEKDPTLKGNEAVFQFEFRNPGFALNVGKYRGVIAASYNGNPFEIILDDRLRYDLKVMGGAYVFQLYADGYLEIYSDTVEILPGYRSTVSIFFIEAYTPVTVDKPVIYLYPETDLDVSVRVKPTGNFAFTYPDYGKGWHGTAHPDGSITIGEKKYPYLFWEAEMAMDRKEQLRTGYVVKTEDLVSFLEEKLDAMGLTTTEQTDFITYWAPRMAASKVNKLQFIWGETCDAFAALTVDPRPDHVNRIYLLWSEADLSETLPEQQLPVFDRSGFDVLEWGGCQLPPVLVVNR